MSARKFIFISCVAGAMTLASLPCHAGPEPVNLECESRLDPMGIDEPSPRLSWQLSDTNTAARGQSQSAYEILVASSAANLAAGSGDLWDSGEVSSNVTAQIPYAGAALGSSEVCYWKVRVWDENGRPSDWSAPATWSMGLMQPGDWKAQWIGRDDAPAWNTGSSFFKAHWIWYPEGNPASSAPVGMRWFRKTVTIPTGVSVSQAVATMAGDDAFTLYVNGQFALSSQTWQQYAQADISSFLVAGTNVLAVAVTNAGTSPNPAGLLGSFDFTYSNGQTNSVQTDGTWATANTLQANWNQLNFDASGWPAADVLGAYGISPWNSFAETHLAATYLRKDFNLATVPPRAVLYVTSQGLVEPHLNGVKVGANCYVPGWTDYTNRLYYFAYDVTSLLEAGSNTLGAILGDGWYRGNCAFSGQNYYGTKLRLYAQLNLFYTNGVQVIPSDASWQAGFGPIRQDDNETGEAYDARLEIPGWDTPGFAHSSWKAAAVGAEHSPTIRAYPMEPIATNHALAPISITQPHPGLYVLNFGQNIAGWARLQVSNQPAGRRIVMRFGEWLNPDGTVFRDNLRTALAMDTYIAKGGGVETWEPRFTYHGFQYLEVQGLASPPTTNTIAALSVQSDLQPCGSFLCSDNLINHYWSNMLWGLRDNYFAVPTDCPQRDERAGWTGDAIQNMRTGMFDMQAESFFSKWEQDILDSRERAGSDFGQQAPLVGDFGFSTAWQDAVVFVPYWLYETYGNTRVMQRAYTNMAAHLAYYASLSSGDIGPNSGYGDWVAVDGSTPLNLISTAFYARCASMMDEMALALGKGPDAHTYNLLFTNICAAFQSSFVSANGVIGSGSEAGYVLALSFHLLTPTQEALAAPQLAAAVASRNGHPSTGMTTTHLLLPTLAGIGRSDLAYQMLDKTDYPSWGYEVGLGATTFWELWDSLNPDGSVDTSLDGMNSLNHASFGTCAEWFYRGILGIDLLAPGFSQVLINPQIGGNLSWARGYYDSIHGRIASAWSVSNAAIALKVSIPANVTAAVDLPTFGMPLTNLLVEESGTNIFANGAATGLETQVVWAGSGGSGAQSYLSWHVPSGSYLFTWTAVAPPSGLTAQAGNGWVDLTWSPVAGATTYQVKRALASGGPYTVLTNTVYLTNFSDTAVTNGVNYYYVVTAQAAGGSSMASPEVVGAPAQIQNFGFEIPNLGAGNYQYNPGGAGWTFGGSPGNGSGITGNNSGFTAANTAAPQGTQVGFVQSYGVMSQTLTGLRPGTNYTITFSAAQRADSGNQHGGESWNVTVNGQIAASYNPGAGATTYADYSAHFTATAPSETLSFVGTDLATGDNTVFIDNVRLAPAIQPAVSAAVLLSPTNGAVFAPNAAIPLEANVISNENQIDGVQFYVNQTNLLGEAANPPYAINWPGAKPGVYSIFARVLFNGGGAADSGAASFTVTAPPAIGGIEIETASQNLDIWGTGKPSQACILEAATNLAPAALWIPVETNFSDAAGSFGFTNLRGGKEALFFRVLQP